MGRQKSHDAVLTLERAAQYVRMSTEHQRYSTANQAHAIAEYAASHSLNVVRTYTDEGKSGLTFEGRRALQQLIADIVSGAADFSTILVYDVSRWGRFQDNDEGAYYEFICKKAGVRICYCAESFENDASLTSSVLKSMKRAMAAEFSRELSRKTFYGASRIIRLGYRAGGTVPYGLRRLLIDRNGAPIKQLEPGQYKALATDRVLPVHGPPEEVETVKTIFHWFVHERKSPGEIAAMLNAAHVPFRSTRPWGYCRVRGILMNEVYVGNNVYNRQSSKLQQKKVSNPPHEWVRAIGSIAPMVSVELFESAKQLIGKTRLRSDTDMLDRLRKLLEQKGYLSDQLIRDTEGMCSPSSYRRRFGSLGKAYRLVGYESNWGVIGEKIVVTRRAILRSAIAEVAKYAADGGAKSVTMDATRHFMVVVDDKVIISVTPCWCTRISGRRELCWRAYVGRRSVNIHFAIVVRLDEANQSIVDYYFLPRSEFKGNGKVWILGKRNRPDMEAYRHKSLDFVTEFVANGCIMKDDPESDEAVSERCKNLRLAMDYDQSSAFAKFLDVSPQRWNNVEIGMPLSKDLAMMVVRKIPELSLDWLYRGQSEGLSPDLAQRLADWSAPKSANVLP